MTRSSLIVTAGAVLVIASIVACGHYAGAQRRGEAAELAVLGACLHVTPRCREQVALELDQQTARELAGVR